MIEHLSGIIEKEIKKFQLPEDLPELYDPISYTLANGGKRIRPLLVMLSAKIFSDNEKLAIHQALAVEFFHNFTLVHDDIMDNAPLRRGKPSVYKKWNPNTAILSGDVLFSLALKEASICRTEVLPKVLETFLDTTVKVCEGQQMDMNFENRKEVKIEEYLKMIELKTAVLLACSMKIGADVAGSDEKSSQKLYDFGLKAGIAFQLMDDYLDSFGDPLKFGKRIGGDIQAGKKTYLHLYTLANLVEKDKINYLKTVQSSEIELERKLPIIKEYYRTSGAEKKIMDFAEELLSEARSLIADIPGNILAKQELINLSNKLSKREN